MPTIPGQYRAHCRDCGRDLVLDTHPPAFMLVKDSCYACGAKLKWHEATTPDDDDTPGDRNG
jgi:hypothetical protein